jgi:hypothetical protein
VVSFEQFPSADNAETLAVRLDDESFGGADWYEILISWDERNKSKAAAAETGLTIVQGADVRLNNPVEYSTAEASVQDIVQNLAEQAGLKYDRQKSLAQTDPICRRWVQNVTIHGKTCQQALEQILKPVGLRCQVENGILVLSRQPTSTAAVTNNLFSNLATMLKNPQQREALRAGQKMMVDQMYGALPLPADRLTALKELLLDRLMAMAEPGLSAMTGTAADRKQAMGTARAIKEEYDQKIQALLGQQEYRVFQEYDKTVTERLLVQTFKNTLPAEARLSTTQEDALLSAMHDEATASQTVMKNNLPPNSIPTSEDLSRQLKLFQQNTLKRASTILTPQQLDQFKNWQEQMATVQTAALKQMFDNSAAP